MATGLNRSGQLGLLLLMILGICACKEDRLAEAALNEASPTRMEAPREDPAYVAPGHVGSPAPQTPEQNDSDSISLKFAQSACRERDPKALFMAYTQSRAVRERYTGVRVTVGRTDKTTKISRQRYLELEHYPLATIDYFYVTSEAGRASENVGDERDARRYVQLEINQAGDRRFVVEWLPGIFEKDLTPPPPDLEDGLGRLVQETGSGGRLLFFPTDDCWELVADVKNPPLEL